MRAFISNKKHRPISTEWVVIMKDGSKSLLKAPTLTSAIDQAKLFGGIEIACIHTGEILASMGRN